MTCAYSQSGNFECQFEHQYYRPVIVDGEHWCQFHAPLEDKNENPTSKKNWIPHEIQNFYSGVTKLCQIALQQRKKLDLSGVVFPGDTDFQDVEFPEVDFSHARFEGNADFQNAQFSGGNANFSSVKFCGETSFSGAMFNGGDVDFLESEFKGRAEFTNAKFNGGNTDFQGTKFSQITLFNKTEFNKRASFQDSRFIMDATFRGTKFTQGKVIFQGAEFLGVDFSHARFTNEDTNFRDAQFHGRADFWDTYYEGNVIFQKSQFFGGEAIFWNAKFQKNVDFSRTNFSGGDAQFNEAEFRGELVDFKDAYFSPGIAAVFSNAKFNGSANFFNSEFSDMGAFFENTEFRGTYVDFQQAKFNEGATFSNALFKTEELSFIDSTFNGFADFTSPGNKDDVDAFQGEVHFENAIFFSEANFNNRNFQQATNFRECIFHKAPHFHGCKLHQETDFTDARFLDSASPGSAMAYRTLKQDMEEKRARQEQLRFYALEMKSRRSEEKKTFLKFISWLYEATSDFGQRVSLPLVWLVFSYFIFATIYTIFFNELLIERLVNADNLHLFFSFSLEQIIRPFGALDSSSLSKFLNKVSPTYLLPLRLIAAIQSFLSLALLLLSGLAARWRFKIG